ncbi:MAG: hypothetical protein CMP12_07150 [Zunongwangia sp.]|jgi:peptidoglycan/xylan/chitin deacetylase (PgdA/CDA1 family)|uniref:polysaccharide deacetylase family protein n=1 Tax=Zunongwangia profunda TaxID=398743 RepID=UPI000C911C8C|nr:polysaccharide deacetylase family protein [Zunongwangia profunda]MAO35681.1 hypothetical protein [Zunongwangia sp.]MCC4230178.1 polysaccharide deacetylase family protein [Zunongwangia profunda]|tara:strand:- start:22745 stop:23707 length:963 start_codon:yes stop_codon:yes gene_type:complete
MLCVANYHYIRTDFKAKYPSIFGFTPSQFKMQLEILSKYGEFISQPDLLQKIEQPFQKNYILITFDDGLKEQYEIAKPILDEMGIPFIFFVNSWNFSEHKLSMVHKIHLLRSILNSEIINSRTALKLSQEENQLAIKHYNYDDTNTARLKYLLNFKLNFKELVLLIDPLFHEYFDESKIFEELYMSKDMLIDLDKNHNLGSHAHQHIPLGEFDEEVISQDLKDSQLFFNSLLGHKLDAISYPYGSFSACQKVSKIAKENNFKLGFTMERALIADLQEDPLLISRYDANDLPLGKGDLFKENKLFSKPTYRNWYENSAIYQ